MEKTETRKPYSVNPRKITPRQVSDLDRWLRELGDISGVVFNRTTQDIPAGNQRSFKIFDINECEIELVEEYDKPDEQGTIAWGFIIWEGKRYNYREVVWDKETEKKANIIANKAGGQFDNAILKAHWTESELLDSGFKRSEIKWVNVPEHYQEQEEPALPNELEQIHTQIGDVYDLNGHRLICGDSTNHKHQDKVLKGRQINLTITDPPYNVDYKTDKHDGILNDKMPDDRFAVFLSDFYQNTTRAMEPGAPWYLFHADSKGHIFRNEFINSGNYLAQCLIWVKNQMVMGRNDYHWKHEPVMLGAKEDPDTLRKICNILSRELGGEPKHYEQQHTPMIYGWALGAKHTWESDRSQSTVIKFDRPKNNDRHPTMKPVGLLEYFINNSSRKGELVWDPFSGSGSTLLATEKQNRIFAGIELLPIHVDRTIRRWVQHKKENKEKITVKKNGRSITKQQWLYAE